MTFFKQFRQSKRQKNAKPVISGPSSKYRIEMLRLRCPDRDAQIRAMI